MLSKILNSIKKIPSIVLLLTATLLVTSGYIFFLSKTSLLQSQSFAVRDDLFYWRAKYSAPLPHLEDVVIVKVDDESFIKMQRAWPWDRDIFAQFLDKVGEYHPKVVGLDFTFLGVREKDSDALFEESLRRQGNVFLGCYFDKNGNIVLPGPAFRSAAAGFGFVDSPLDIDAVSRRSRVFTGSVFSFSSKIAYSFMGKSLPETSQLKAERLASYRYLPSDFQSVPFWRIMNGSVPKKFIENKIVLVGPTSPAFHDIHNTPIGFIAGIYSHANDVLEIVDRDFIRPVPFKYLAGILIFLTVLFTVLFSAFTLWPKIIIFVVAEFLIYQGALSLLVRQNILLEPFPLMLVLALVFFMVYFVRGLRALIENATLHRLVVLDDLTGLYSHRYLVRRLNMEYERHVVDKQEFCAAMVDIDFFKKVNDTYGHEMGNVVLKRVAKTLRESIRGQDVLARYGGEEFCIFFIRCGDREAEQTMNRIRLAVEKNEFQAPQGNFHVTISSGICSNKNADVKSEGDIIKLADQALYAAKNSGRNRVCVYGRG